MIYKQIRLKMTNYKKEHLQKESEEADSEMVVRKKKSHLMEDLKVTMTIQRNKQTRVKQHLKMCVNCVLPQSFPETLKYPNTQIEICKIQVYFAVALLLLIAGGIIVAKINMEPQSGR